MRWFLIAELSLCCLVMAAQGQGQVGVAKQGDLSAADLPAAVLEEGFERAESLAGWAVGAAEQGIRVEKGVLVVERPESLGPGSTTITRRLPIEELRGRRIKVEARMRADRLTKAPHPWNGVKVMLHVEGPKELWPQAPLPQEGFDWSAARFMVTIPGEAEAVTLVLGLESCTGRVEFDDVRVAPLAPRRTGPFDPSALDRRHDRGRLRGAMIGPRVDAEDLREFGEGWKANHVRWQLIWGGFPGSPADTASIEEYDAWLEGELQRLERLLPVCEKAGILALVDLHTPPGGREKQSLVCRIFQEKRFQEHFLAVWERIARRLRDQPAVWGYDLVNEPLEGAIPAGLKDWQELAGETARRVRAIDAKKAIVVEPAPWGSPPSLEFLEPLVGIPGVVYSVHMYMPHQFTHQGVYDNPRGVSYPGTIDGEKWDKDRIRRAFEPVIQFQRDFNVPIYIGEFSAIRWAPGTSARDYLRDVIDVMEEEGWDWAYHAFREWDGWSVEHGNDSNDRKPASSPTDRELLLRSYYERNKAAGSQK